MATPLQKDIQHLLNRYSQEKESDTPDFVLAEYLIACLDAFETAIARRKEFAPKIIGKKHEISENSSASDFMDENAVAATLGISKKTLQQWRFLGRGPKFVKLGRLCRYKKEEIDNHVNSRTVSREY